MAELYPLAFEPIFKERVWGGTRLASSFRKRADGTQPIGESWEITDRPEGVSVVANGQHAGKNLRWLMTHHQPEVMGEAAAPGGRFPLLVKLLDAQEKLSLQVHPTARIARELHGEPKTEIWYVAEAATEALIYAGLRRGVTRELFEQHLRSGTVGECVHRIPVRAGDVMFIPSGRLHAIGGGLVIFEIQQNSDTTYRVFDWNRLGLDGKPRALHCDESLASIDFNDVEPTLVESSFALSGALRWRCLTRNECFEVNEFKAEGHVRWEAPDRHRPQIVAVTQGEARIIHAGKELNLVRGGFALLPACLGRVTLAAEANTNWLVAQPGDGTKEAT